VDPAFALILILLLTVALAFRKRAVHVPRIGLLMAAAYAVLATDIERFRLFSAGWLGIYPAQPDVLVDVRYSSLPNSVAPMWAIKIDPARPWEHASYTVSRDSSSETRKKFLELLMGTPQ